MKQVLDQIELIATIIEGHPAMTQDEEFRKQVADGFAELKNMMHERQLAQQANEAKLSQMQSDITRLARNVEDERLIVRLSILEQSFAGFHDLDFGCPVVAFDQHDFAQPFD